MTAWMTNVAGIPPRDVGIHQAALAWKQWTRSTRVRNTVKVHVRNCLFARLGVSFNGELTPAEINLIRLDENVN